MFVSLNWLKQYIDIDHIDPEDLAEQISKTGIEVDGIEHFASATNNVVVGYVESCEQHPNADKLNLCQVNVGDETLQIICGAPNVAQGQKVAVAKPGAVLPGNFKIKKAKLRGVESNGMICSLQELGVDEKYVPKAFSEGIFVFPDEVEVGDDVNQLLNLDDVIFEFDLTPNRSDALSMLGVAYEVAAILDVDVHLPQTNVSTTAEKAEDKVSVRVDAPQQNPYYGAFLVKDISIGPSPLWMRNYLMAAGIRPINNVVDITNYVLLEYGQPLHAFDYDQFGSDQVVVRLANEGETMVTLDEQERSLAPHHLVITNGDKPHALAGVMGGADAEVTDQTKTVLIEAAYFDPKTVRQASSDFDLKSESSARFEKGVDPNRVRQAGERACQLLEQYAGATVLDGVAEFDQLDKQEKTVTIWTSTINDRLGTNMTNQEVADILRKLHFHFHQEGETFNVFVPTRRQDIHIFEDMLEEVARIYGYDEIPFTLPQGGSQAGGLTRRQQLKRYIKRFLEGAGLMETVTYSLTNEERINHFISPEIQSEVVSAVPLKMPMSEDHSTLRLSLVPEMLQVISYNLARKQGQLAYYEMGSVFLSHEGEVTKQPAEKERVTGVFTGEWVSHPWQQEKKLVDFFVVKGIVDALFYSLNISVTYKQTKMDGMHPGRTAQLFVNHRPIGFIGQVHPKQEKAYDLNETYVFDLDLDYLLDIHHNAPSFNQIPRNPSVTRDIALVVDQSVHAGDLEHTILTAGGELINDVHVFDVYQGEHLEEGKKSIAFSIHYQDPNRTLTDEEVESSYQAIMDAVKEKHQAVLRG
ncbi:phenylalanyl-tRNA synthetase subunit beta [Gracilibacillus halophilus YIM-C55.5]|uniref:Phenylalanine--tRNA ligase beta subunit n=1 Tax=Gracilibacillus halophilus YIM-C55.5 TaxID=1308866 RepID=N4WRN0_9BACI|nr:phenylalanine--tRNA ligase subunit beta [Gracilibacillus halophilus]ENH97040.1 phenylalanyl-tRNA synthetase subunit beta [Gracilibacillus halophilus YIM-C55.5]